MITKTGNKKSFKPYTTDGKTSVVMWDFQPFLNDNQQETEFGSWKIEKFDKVMTFDEVKAFILDYYNSQINEKIISGMEWNGLKVWLSNENQFNYKTVYDLAIQTNGANLPVKFKFGEPLSPKYFKFTTIEELTDFYFSVIKHIQKTLNDGWKKKDSIKWSVYRSFIK